MRILSLTLENFKGVKSLTVDFGGDNANIYGDNGTYKTTIKDAYLWLLFGVDSQGKTDFAVKTLDESGAERHYLNHAVEGTFLIKGKPLTLRRVYTEKWERNRKSTTEEMTGHTTDYYRDGVPIAKEADYKALVKSIAPEEIFKVLSDPAYFSNLPWKVRRATLMEVCGDLTDAEVIASDKSLAQLPAILQDRALEDHQKKIAAERAKINDELKEIPTRIDEKSRDLPDITGIDVESVQAQLATLKEEYRATQEMLVQAESGGEITSKNLRLAEVEAEIIRIKNNLTTERSRLVAEQRKILDEYQVALESYYREYNSLVSTTREMAEANQKLRDKQKALREEWWRVKNVENDSDSVCPTCGQALPADKVESAAAAFNLHKSEQLAAIQEEGKPISEKLAEQDALLAQLEEKKVSVAAELEEAKSRTKALAEDMRATENMPLESDSLTQAIEGKALLLESIAELKSGVADGAKVHRDNLRRLEMHIKAAEDALRKVAAYQAGQVRIEELKRQEEGLAAKYERLLSELYLCEDFIRRKVALLEEKINSKFRYARIKLFKKQVNGGIIETCETTYKGVPYSRGLNNGHRGIVGLDIISTLADHYGFHPPIFYDNAESVTSLPEMKSQLIALYVSESDKVLRVVTVKEKLKEAI